jgi:hypothetical protein
MNDRLYKVTARIDFETTTEVWTSELADEQSLVNKAQENLMQHLSDIGFFGRHNIANIMHMTKIEEVDTD